MQRDSESVRAIVPVILVANSRGCMDSHMVPLLTPNSDEPWFADLRRLRMDQLPLSNLTAPSSCPDNELSSTTLAASHHSHHYHLHAP